jgi:hypothetical protein
VAQLQAYLLTQIRAAASISNVTYRAYQPDSDTLFDEVVSTVGLPGVGNSGVLPPQCAVVVSLLTAGFGRAFRGRVYVPTNGILMDATNLQLSAAQTTAEATAFGNYLSAMLLTSFTPVLVSRSRGASSPITHLRVDSVVDTQRRRRDKFVAAHAGTALVTPD